MPATFNEAEIRRNRITPNDELVLARQDTTTLATWWGILNNGGWPAELADEEPPYPYAPNNRRWQLMRRCENATSLRMCYRHSPVWVNESEEFFNDFWQGVFEGDAAAKQRYEARLSDV